MTADIDNHSVARAYARWAPVYDLVFDKIRAPGRRAGAAAVSRIGGRALDVGVGTGLELPYFDGSVSLTGVDLSEPMLRRAHERVRDARLRHVAGLAVMDAMHLGFAEATFDSVIAPYFITTVPDPETTLDELVRVLRPGGELILVNHLSADAGMRAAFERWLARQTRSLGWRPEFPWSRIANWAASRDDLDLVERRPMAPLGLFTLVRFGKREAAAQPLPSAA